MYKSLDDIKTEYDRIRQANEIKCSERKALIYKEHPKLKEYDGEIFSLFVKLVRSGQSNGALNETESDIEKEIENVRNERNKYLKDNGIEDNYREVQYTCNKCKDTGFVNGRKCSCFIEKEIELFDNISNFKKYIINDNFSKLDMSYYKQGDSYFKYMTTEIENIKKAIKEMDTKPFNILFIGPPGTGKTFLARSIGAEVIKLNKSVLYLNAMEYIDSLKPDYDGMPLKKYAINADLFIIDDLGTEYSSEFSKTEINYIIDKRLNDQKSTIITSNLIDVELKARYLAPMCSRLDNLYHAIGLFGDDLRRLKKCQ